MSEEKTFFQRGNATVTSARVVLNDTTYALRNVTSVKMRVQSPKVALPVTIALIALVVALGAINSGNWEIFGIASATCALFTFVVVKSRSSYIVAMATSAGEVDALKSTDKVTIQSIVDAISEAIVHRS